jgi:hypothetical protein
MNKQALYAQTAASGIAQGLGQELKLIPGQHYRPSAHVAKRVVKFKLRGINPHYLDKILGMQKPLTMWAGLPDTQSVRIGWDTGSTLSIEIPKPRPLWQQVTIQGMLNAHQIRRGAIATLGLDLDDRPVRLNLDEPALAHIFITGQTRSGKTNAQKLLAWNLVNNTESRQAGLLILDVAKRGKNWRVFDGLKHLRHPVVTGLREALAALNWLDTELDERAANGATTPKLIVFVDELKALIDDNEQAAKQLSRVAAIGGEFGIHLILATQYPQVKMLGSAELKRNITTRLCGRVDDAAAAANALGIKASGAESLQGYGDFLLKDLDGLTRFTVAHMDDAILSGSLTGNEVLPLDAFEPDDKTGEALQGGLPPRKLAKLLLNWGSHEMGLARIRQTIGGNNNSAKLWQRYTAALIAELKAQGDDGLIDLSELGLGRYMPKKD